MMRLRHAVALTCAVLLLSASPAFAQWSHGAGSDTSISGGTTCVSNAFSATSGDLLVAFVFDGANVTWSGVTDAPGGNTWHQATGAAVNNGAGSLDIWYAYNITGNASDVVTATHSAGGSCSMAVRDYHYTGGSLSVDPFDVGANHTSFATSSPITSNSFTTSAAGDLIVAIGGNGNGNGTWTAGSGFTLDLNEAVQDVQTQDQFSGASGAQTAAIANNAASPLLNLGVASFKAPAGGGGGTTSVPLALLGAGPGQ